MLTSSSSWAGLLVYELVSCLTLRESGYFIGELVSKYLDCLVVVRDVSIGKCSTVFLNKVFSPSFLASVGVGLDRDERG